MEKNYFTELYSVDVHDKIKQRTGLATFHGLQLGQS